jgi:tRNA threonylcarbamoyladenosine biosynthesis protein TsaE
MTECFRVVLEGLSQTESQALALAPLLHPGDTLCVDGALGVGKTAFARALIQSWMGDSSLGVPSPTFNLVLTYEAPQGVVLWHVDLYRLGEADSRLTELGLEEAFHQAIVLVEWPQRLGDRYLKLLDPLWIHLSYGEEHPKGDDNPHGRVLRYGGSPRWCQRLAAGGLRPC